MKKGSINLNDLKGRNPFRVPDGYFENFTERMMAKLPEREMAAAKKISIYTRVKPWLYLAASFAALIFLFNVMNKSTDGKKRDGIVSENISAIDLPVATIDENADFLDYVEDLYADKYAYNYIDDLF